MSKISYITGDVLNPVGDGYKIIPHVCNDIGGWGSGLVIAISKRWKDPEFSYRYWFKKSKDINSKGFYNTFKLGMIQCIEVEDDILIINMIAQHNTISIAPGTKPIRYDALKTCLEKVAIQTLKYNTPASVHMGRIGCGLAGGKWKEVEKIIQETLISRNIPVYIYTLEGDKSWR